VRKTYKIKQKFVLFGGGGGQTSTNILGILFIYEL
jgi:hypothetical protein